MVDELSQALKRVKDIVLRMATERMTRGDYVGGKTAADCLQAIDSIASRLNHSNGTVDTPMAALLRETKVGSQPPRLPYYYREGDRLIKVGKSDKGDGTYRHPVSKVNFDEIMSVLVAFAKASLRFDTKDLQNQVHRIPRHEPGIVLAVLEEQRLLRNTRRGQWEFKDRAGPGDSASVWNNIPDLPYP